MEIKTQETSLLTMLDPSTPPSPPKGDTPTQMGKDFKQFIADLLGPENAKLMAQKSLDSKQVDKAGLAKDSLQKDKSNQSAQDKSKDATLIDPALVLSTFMLRRNLEELIKSKDLLALNNKDLVGDIKSLITQLADQIPQPLSNGAASSKPTGTVPRFKLDPAVSDKINALTQKYPQATDLLNAGLTKTVQDFASGLKAAFQDHSSLARLSMNQSKAASQAAFPTRMIEPQAQRANPDVVARSDAQGKKTPLTPLAVTQSAKTDTRDEHGVKKPALPTEEKAPQIKPALNSMPTPQLLAPAQVQVAVRVSSPAPMDATAFRQNIIDQVDSAVKLQVNAPQNEVRIKLNPPSLGEIIIKLQMMEDKAQPGKQVVVSNMVVENESVKDALLSGVNQLRTTMQDHSGVNLKDFNVMVRTGQEFTPGQRQQESSAQNFRRKRFSTTSSDEAEIDLSSVMKELDGIFEYVA